jgi:bifunctional DNase/RNase
VDKIELEILGLSSSQSQTGSFALVLGEVVGKRRLPIIIGMFEAQAIAIEIEKISPNRPMTHDLFKSFAKSFDFSVEEIIISDLREGVFFAQIVCNDGFKKIEIDARPSDAIAIGLRFNAPIYTYENIMSEAGIVLSTEEEEEDEEDDEEEEKTSSQVDKSEVRRVESKGLASDKGKNKWKDYSVEQLSNMLSDAINNENYEEAARIRDEITNREGEA